MYKLNMNLFHIVLGVFCISGAFIGEFNAYSYACVGAGLINIAIVGFGYCIKIRRT